MSDIDEVFATFRALLRRGPWRYDYHSGKDKCRYCDATYTEAQRHGRGCEFQEAKAALDRAHPVATKGDK